MSEDVNMQETTPAEPTRDDLWTQIVSGDVPPPPPQEEEAEEEPQTIEVTPDDPPEEPEPEPEPQQSESKLSKRLRDSQEFISQLKRENKEKDELLERLKSEVEDLKTARSEPPQTQPKAQEPTPAVSDINTLLNELPDDVREELEAFPELLRGMTTLFDKRIQQMQSKVNPEIEEFKKERQQRQVREALELRHKLADEQLGITNSTAIDFDSPVFAQYVLANEWRKGVVTDFGNPQGFVDLLRGFLFEYPDEAKRPVVEEPEQPNSDQREDRRRAASNVVSRKSAPERPKPKANTPANKAAFWAELTRG